MLSSLMEIFVVLMDNFQFFKQNNVPVDKRLIIVIVWIIIYYYIENMDIEGVPEKLYFR
jgi:hypothetical protein